MTFQGFIYDAVRAAGADSLFIFPQLFDSEDVKFISVHVRQETVRLPDGLPFSCASAVSHQIHTITCTQQHTGCSTTLARAKIKWREKDESLRRCFSFRSSRATILHVYFLIPCSKTSICMIAALENLSLTLLVSITWLFQSCLKDGGSNNKKHTIPCFR